MDHTALASVVLIVLETLISGLLRVDRESRELAQPFVDHHATIRVQAQFPALVFYASFTEKGLLLDWLEPPRAVIAGTVTASLMDLVRGFVTAPSHVLDKIQIEGDLDTVQRLEALMQSLNIQHIFKNGWRMFWNAANEPDLQPRKSRVNRSSTLVRKLEHQQKLMEQLNLQLIEQRNDFKALQMRYSRMLAAAVVLVIGLLLALIWVWWRLAH